MLHLIVYLAGFLASYFILRYISRDGNYDYNWETVKNNAFVSLGSIFTLAIIIVIAIIALFFVLLGKFYPDLFKPKPKKIKKPKTPPKWL